MNRKRFLKGKGNKKKEKIKKESQDKNEEEIFKSKTMDIRKEEEEDSEEAENLENNENQVKDVESLSDSLDEERWTLGQINSKFNIERNNDEKNGTNNSFLGFKRFLRYDPITYDEKKHSLTNVFCSSAEELNAFLSHCQIQKYSYEDFSPNLLDNNIDSIKFNPNDWMKTNDIEQRLINLEDLSVYYNRKSPKKITKKSVPPIQYQSEKSEKQIEAKKDKEIEIKNEIKNEKGLFKEGKDNKPQFDTKFKNKKIYDNSIELQKIIDTEDLSNEQKEWLNNFFKEIDKIDINDIKIEKDEKGKDNKLELVFDLDYTCIFSFIVNSDNLFVQAKKKFIPQKEAKMISFEFNNKVLYCMLIIRKGLKEFINYIKPLCNFHISTLGAENYGKEIAKILMEEFEINFERFKGRFYDYESTKKISDLYINKEKTIILDDNIKIWENENGDNENVIISKFFFDEECAMINEKEDEKKPKNENILYEIDLFLKSYRNFYYNKITDNGKNTDWKIQEIMDYPNPPFYQFKQNNDFNFNKCFTAEYLNSSKFQLTYLKNVIKEIYILKFVYNIDTMLAIKLIRISTLYNMVFDLKYLTFDQRNVLSDIIKLCGGKIFKRDFMKYNNTIYLVASKRLFELKNKQQEILSDLEEYPYYVLINEKYILDTYYFMTNLKDIINDPEYTFGEEN